MRVLAPTVGPILGHTSTNEVRIWGRAEFQQAIGKPRRAFGIARIKPANGHDFGGPVYFKMNPNFDMTGVVAFNGLLSETRYEYQLGWFFDESELDNIAARDWDWSDSAHGEFTTASDGLDTPIAFVFGSCRYLLRLFGGSWFDDRGDKTFRSILDLLNNDETIGKLLMVGDQIYADDLNFLSPDEYVEQYFARYRAAFSQPSIRELMSRLPTYMTWDDHEIEDNWPSGASSKDMLVKFPAAAHAYQVYQTSHSPLFDSDPSGRIYGTPEKYFYEFSDGCCDFFVTDSRTERDPDNGQMISEAQMGSLLRWLGDQSGRVKAIVTSVPFFPDMVKESADKWSGYLEQRDRILEFVRAHGLRKVVFLSGDIHCSVAAELKIGGPGSDLSVYSVVSSSFFWPYPHIKRNRVQLTGQLASLVPRVSYTLGRVSNVFSGDNFSRVRVTPDSLEVEVYERKGASQHVFRFQF